MIERQGALPGFEELAAAEDGVSLEQAVQVSTAAWEAFEELLDDPGRPVGAGALCDPFRQLTAQGWPWRKALYIAWARLPRTARWPQDHEQLAEVMGLRSARTIRQWRSKNPEIERQVQAAMVGRVMERTADILQAAEESALSEGYRGFNDRKMLLEIAGVYKNEAAIEVRTPVNADEMAERQRAAAEELGEWEAGRWGEELPAVSSNMDGRGWVHPPDKQDGKSEGVKGEE